MATATIEVASRLTSPNNDVNSNDAPAMFVPWNLPAINYQPSRWATFRTRNVDDIAQQWANDESLAVVFGDPKLDGNELVLLRLDTLRQIITPLLELQHGRAALRLDVNMIVTNVEALFHSLNSLVGGLDKQQLTTREAAQAALENIKLLRLQIQKFSASVVLAQRMNTPTAQLTEEEKALADELLREESGSSPQE